MAKLGRNAKRKPLERTFKARVKRDLDALEGCYYFVKEARAIRGIPDIIGCVRGKFFALELKRDVRARRTALQTYEMTKIRTADGFGAFANPQNWDTILGILTSYSKEGDKSGREEGPRVGVDEPCVRKL